jgi:Putative Ig domain/BspA type Leucine rich repeat region (6 copies)
LFISATLAFTLLPPSSAHAAVVTFNCPGGGTYSVDSGVLSSMYSGNCAGDVILDSSVTRINYATALNSLVTSIEIPATTTTIGTQPFTSGIGLTEIKVSNSNPNYKSVDGILYNIAGTTLIQYPQAKPGTTFTIPSGVTTIGNYAFSCAKFLETVNIPDNVTTATGIDRPNGCSAVNNISQYIVSAGNSNYSSIDGVLFNKNATTLIAYPYSKAGTSYVMPSTVTSLTTQSLSSSKNNQLQSITLSPNLVSIAQYSFLGLNLLSLNIPASVTTIATLGLYGVKSITVDPASTSFVVEDEVLFNANKTTLIYYPTSKSNETYTVPSSVTAFQTYAFYSNNSYLQRLIIGSTLASVGDYNMIPNLKFLSITGDTTFNFSNFYLSGLISVNYCGSNATTISNIDAKLATWNNSTRGCVTSPAFSISANSETATVSSAISGYTVSSTGGTIATYSISPVISNTPGLSFNTSTGRITGTPTTVANSRTYTITASNAANTATQTFAITVNPAAPAFTLSSSTISATSGVAVSGYTVSSTGGTIASYSISPAISNTPGLVFSTSTGLISGTPTTAATSLSYTVTATNATNSATRTFAITVSAPAPVVEYVAPTPVPYLKTLTKPELNLKDGKLICTPGIYNAGYTLDGVVQGSATALFTPSSFTYNLLINGISQTSLVVTSASSSNSWNMSVATSGALIACSVAVSANGVTNTDRSSDNTSATSSALTTQATSITTANADYSALLSANSKAYQKALVDNRTTWRKQIDAIRSNYYDTLNRIKAKGGSKMVTDTSTALKVMIAAQKKSAADYAASKPAALAAKDAADKAALVARDVAIAKANAAYGTFIESIGYGVLIP